MNKIFRKLTARTFLNNIKLFLSVILIVFLSSMLLSGFICNYKILDNTINTYFEKTNLADLWFYVDNVSNSDEEFFNSSKIEYDKRLYIETRAEISSGHASNNAKIYISDGKISNPYKESGKWGCVIDKNVYRNNNLTVGEDKISFTIEKEIFGKTYELDLSFDITGIMSHSECADSFSSWPIFITEDLFLDKVNESIDKILGENNIFHINEMSYNQILVKTNNIDKTKILIENYYNEQSKNNLLYSFDKSSVESVLLLSSEIQQARKLIYVFPLIFLVVSVLIILTSINQLVLQEKQKIGMLKSIGVSNKLIMSHYCQFGAVFCFIGSVLGVIFGVIIIPSVMFIKYRLVYSIPNDYIKFILPVIYILLVIIGLTLLGYIISAIACKNILSKKPIELLRFDAKSSKIKGFGRLHKLPFSIKMAFRNLRLKPVRTIMATVGIMGCVALLLCGFGIQDTITNSINYDFGKTFHYDITTTYTRDDFEENIREIDDISFFEKYEKIYVSAKSDTQTKNVNLYKLRRHSILSDIYLETGDVFVSKSIMDELKLNVGQKIIVVCGSGSKELTITKAVTTSVLNGIYVSEDLGFDDSYKIYGMWIECDNVTDSMVDYINTINGTNTASSMSQYIDNINNKISSISIMTTTLKVFAISLAIVVLLNLILLIMKERIKELATLKVLGQDNFTIVLTLFYEILFMTIFGSIAGAIFGKPLLILVLSINKVEVLNYLYHINFLSYIGSAIIILFTIIIVTALCYRKVIKINMIQSLKSVE